MINEDAPTMSAGNGGFTGSAAATGPNAGFDPLLGSKKVKRRKYGTKKIKEEPEVYWSSEALDQLDQINERLGGKGYSKKATGGGGDWEDSDRGEGNKAKRRAGQKVKVKSPTYIAHVKNKNVKEGREERSGKDNYLPFKVCYDDAEPYVLYGRSVAEIKIQLRKIYRPEMHKKIYVKRLYPNEVIKMYYDLRMKALANQ